MSGIIRNQRGHIDVGPGGNRRKTGHVTRACNTCRRKKSKCDGKQPICRACADSGHECTWTAEEDSRRPATKQYVESLKNTNKFQAEQIKMLEAQLAAAGLKAESMGPEGSFNPNSGSPSAGLFGGMPLPSSSQTHSPAGSYTAELPADAFLSPNAGIDYDSHSDSESVAENLSNAASRLVITDGDLAAVGPSSLQFHRPSPIMRTVPLDEAHGDGPKHTLHLSDDMPPSLSHSRNPSGTHNRSRSRSQTRSVGHSRASSVSPHGITPPSQTQNFAGGVSPPVAGLFQTLSPPTTGGGGAPYLDASSPGSDNFGVEQNAIDQILGGFQRDQFTPNPHGDDEDEDRYDWKQMLPQDVDLTRIEHDTLLDIFFKVFSSWCYRTIPDLFLRDMRRYLENTRIVKPDNSQSPSEEKIVTVGPKAVHYTPMLHNAILSIALAYSDDPQLSRRSTRAKFVEKAKSTLETECSRPSLACVHALAYIASFYSGEGEQTLGFLFFGMSIRMSQALGLSIDCSSWVRSGHISSLDETDRIWTYWSAYSLDKCWAFYVGRDHGLPQPLLKASQQPPMVHSDSNNSVQSASSQNSTFSQGTVRPVAEIKYPTADDKADNASWEWKAPGNWNAQGGLTRRTVSNTPSSISSAFYQTCKLMVLATRVMNAIWHLPKNASSESISPLALEVDQWLEDLPDAMRINRPRNTQALPHILMINMAHQWLQIILHRPFYTLTQNKSDQSIKRCDSGAEKILQYLAAWRRLYELRYVPITVVQIAFIAGTTCLLKAIQSANMPEKRRTSLEGVTEIIRALSEMGTTWKSALQSADALKVLRREQVSGNERSPGPSRHPTVELQPPSVANSRAQTMDMAYELHPSSLQFSSILEQTGNVYAEPSSDMQMNDPFLQGGYSAESPGSSHSGQYFSANEGIQVHNQGHGHFVGGNDPNTNMGIPGLPAGMEGLYGYGQLGYIGANDGRLRGGESFPNHPTGAFGGPVTQAGPIEGPEAWYGSGYGYPGVPNQQGHQQAYWGQ